MREYKFRAYHTKSKQILYADAANVFQWKNELQPIEIMQYTGLNGKNGTDIYESDVVIDTLTKATYLVKFGFCKKYAFNGWYLKGINIDMESSITDGKSECFEVIGNVHQNPELL